MGNISRIKGRDTNLPPLSPLWPIFDRSGFVGSGSVQTTIITDTWRSQVTFHTPANTTCNDIVFEDAGYYSTGQNGLSDEVVQPYGRWIKRYLEISDVRYQCTWRGKASLYIPPGFKRYRTDPLPLTSNIAASSACIIHNWVQYDFRLPRVSVVIAADGTVGSITVLDAGKNINQLLTVSVAGGGVGTFTCVVDPVTKTLTTLTPVGVSGKTPGSPSVTFSNGVTVQTSWRRVSGIDVVDRGIKLADVTASGNPANQDQQFEVPPGVFAKTVTGTPEAAIFLGNSWFFGNSDSNTTADANGRIGVIAKCMTNAIGCYYPSSGGNTLKGFRSSAGMRLASIRDCAAQTVVSELLYNDTLDSAGPGEQELIDGLRWMTDTFLRMGKRVWLSTPWPKTFGDWTTVDGQRLTRPGREKIRLSVYDTIMTKYTEWGVQRVLDINAAVSYLNPYSGKFRVDGGAWTTDGTHPGSAVAIPALVAQPFIDPTWFHA